jgi:hypothetical protein
VHRSLRAVLARRLLRAERGPEALSYFDASTRQAAEQYVVTLEQAKAVTSKFERAQKLLAAATVLRAQGMRLIGTEVAPDFRWTGGSYDPFYGEWPAHFDSLDAGLSAQELVRERASAPRDNVRFHYRALASRLTEQAADQVSKRSQAFTALLCESAKPVMDQDPERAQTLWRRAVKEGPLLKEPMVFGRACPSPRFVEPPEPRHTKIQFRKRTLLLMSAGSGVLVAGVVALFRRRKRAS